MDTTDMKKPEDKYFDDFDLFLNEMDDDWDENWEESEQFGRIIGIRLSRTSKELSDRREDYTQRQTFTIDEGDYITFMLQSGMETDSVMAMWKKMHEISIEVEEQVFVLNGRFTCKHAGGCMYLVTGRIRWTDMAGMSLQDVNFHIYMGNERKHFTNAKTYTFLPARMVEKIEPLELYLTTSEGNMESCTRHGFGPDERDYAYVWFVCNNNLPEEYIDNLLVEVEFDIFDENGFLQKQTVTQAFVPEKKEMVAKLYFNMIGWEDGFYRVYVKVWGQTICHAIFGIGKRLNGKSMMILNSRKKNKNKSNHGSSDIKAIEQIHKMIGLKEVKKHLEQNIYYVQMMEARKQKGLPCVSRLMHVVMTGSPGTGKTTVARLLGAAYKQMNILSSGHTVECNRATLVQDHVGGTEKATLDKIEEAKGGVLFIDEAYALFAGTKPSNDFGMRIIDSLMTVLSDPKSETLVVLAGYEDKMKELLDANPGLASRFPVHLHFPDYTVDELMLMAESWFTENKYKANAQVMQRIRSVIEKVINEKGFGAGRFIHTFIENTILPNMATRLYARVPLVEYDNKVLARILPEDVPEPGEILARIKGPEKKVRAIGFH